MTSACDRPAEKGARSDVDPLASRHPEQFTVSEFPVLRLGAASGSPDQTFHSVVYAGRLSDGRVVVVDGGSLTVRWFSSAGVLERQAGDRGGGPGEFERIADALLLRGDTLVVHDSRNNRATWFGPHGSVVREQPVRGSGEVALIGANETNAIVYAQSRFEPDVGRPDYSYAQATLSVKVSSAAGEEVIAERPGADAVYWVRHTSGRPTVALRMALPFGHEAPVAATRSAIAVSVDGGRSIELLDLHGRQLDRFTLDGWRGPVVSGADRERYAEAAFEEAQRSGRNDPEGARRGARERIALLPRDHQKPAFDRILAADDGNFWVRDYMTQRDERQTWRIVHPSHGVVGIARLPAGLNVMHVTGSFVTWLERDDLGVEYVGLYRLQR